MCADSLPWMTGTFSLNEWPSSSSSLRSGPFSIFSVLQLDFDSGWPRSRYISVSRKSVKNRKGRKAISITEKQWLAHTDITNLSDDPKLTQILIWDGKWIDGFCSHISQTNVTLYDSSNTASISFTNGTVYYTVNTKYINSILNYIE